MVHAFGLFPGASSASARRCAISESENKTSSFFGLLVGASRFLRLWVDTSTMLGVGLVDIHDQFACGFGKRLFVFFFIYFFVFSLTLSISPDCILSANGNGLFSSPLQVFGVILFAVGFGFECIADRQKSTFRARNQTDFIASGLWSISRHPN